MTFRSEPETPVKRPIVWTVAGSDSSGGAGIQADLLTMNSLGVHGCSVVTALTAQNTLGVSRVDPTTPAMVSAQLDALSADFSPGAVKLGMLPTEHAVRAVLKTLGAGPSFVVCDPVLTSSSGHRLVDPSLLNIWKEELLPSVDLLTPNKDEAELLLGTSIHDREDMEEAAEQILKLGVRAVVLKGGHMPGETCRDLFADGQRMAWLSSRRLSSPNTHGTGCTFSSAVAAGVASGLELLDAVVVGKAYVNQGIRRSSGIGSGHGPLQHGGWPKAPEDLPQLTFRDDRPPEQSAPALASSTIGLYPIVDRVSWLKRLLPLGVSYVQLRAKDLSGPALEQEVHEAVELAREFDCHLFINDDWESALKAEAYGVHLGQDDLNSADLNSLTQAGVRLGISTHSYSELARAKAFRPSYVALGTLFETSSKVMDYPPLGLNHFYRMRNLVDVPTVAIGGISIDRAAEVKSAGADGAAVISEITRTPDLQGRIENWLRIWPGCTVD